VPGRKIVIHHYSTGYSFCNNDIKLEKQGSSKDDQNIYDALKTSGQSFKCKVITSSTCIFKDFIYLSLMADFEIPLCSMNLFFFGLLCKTYCERN
jgi:hypothetical protein